MVLSLFVFAVLTENISVLHGVELSFPWALGVSVGSVIIAYGHRWAIRPVRCFNCGAMTIWNTTVNRLCRNCVHEVTEARAQQKEQDRLALAEQKIRARDEKERKKENLRADKLERERIRQTHAAAQKASSSSDSADSTIASPVRTPTISGEAIFFGTLGGILVAAAILGVFRGTIDSPFSPNVAEMEASIKHSYNHETKTQDRDVRCTEVNLVKESDHKYTGFLELDDGTKLNLYVTVDGSRYIWKTSLF
ncbi:MAG: hypothetical protein ACR2IE_07385 [Candidatus Sumerlaeaceae bacterium]